MGPWSRRYGKQCTAAFHVDDIFLTHASLTVLESVADEIESEFTSVKRQREPEFMHLGVRVARSESGDIELSQDVYVAECCEAWGCKSTAVTPATEDLLSVDEESTPLCKDKRDAFHSAVEKVLYVTKRTRPEILVAVSFLAGRLSSPTEQDWAKLDRVFCYLSGTPGVMFCDECNFCYKDQIELVLG
jgi:hypothetical protein